MDTKNFTIVLALYPNMRGLGYALVKAPETLLDSGLATVRPLLNGKLFTRISRFVEYYKPTIIVMRGYEQPISLRSRRIHELLESIRGLAAAKNIPYYSYTRLQIRDTFELFGARTKLEIAQKIIERMPELKRIAPTFRKSYMPEQYHMGVFDALSLFYTHRYLE